MYSFLLDRHQASDFDGTLTVNILKLLARFLTMDEDVLQKTNVMKLLPRIMKKGGKQVKELAQVILDNAAASTKRKEEAAKAAASMTAASSLSKEEFTYKDATASEEADGSQSDPPATKRPREAESNGLPAAKRVATPQTVKNAVSKTGNGTASSSKRETSVEVKTIVSTPNAAVTMARPKANIVAPKPTSLFGSLTSASKKPGTSNAARAAAAAAAAAAAKEKMIEKETPPPPPPKPTLSFGDILADLNKPKDPVSTKPADDRPPETEEERKRRLRKEARRKLRVSWKPDESLTETHLFTHYPEEELGPNDSMTRDLGDIKEEGRILKLHKDLDDDDNEDEDGIKEEELRIYRSLSEINFSVLVPDQAGNFLKRGGSQEPTSPEKEAQEHREATTLMVFYTSPGDIPPSPKEPPALNVEEKFVEEVSFGEPGDQIKAREARYFAAINPQPAAAPQPAPSTSPLDVTNLLKILQMAPQQQQQQQSAQPQSTPPPQPAQQAPVSDLERTINMFRQQQGQPLVAPPLLPVSQPSTSTAQGVDLQKLLAVINAQKQIQQPNGFQQSHQSQPSITPNLAAFISQFGNKNQSQPSSQTQQQQLQGQIYEDPERKRMRETTGVYDGTTDDRFNQTKRSKTNGDPKQKKHPKAGLVACRYWREGKCLKGDDCTFRHDPLD